MIAASFLTPAPPAAHCTALHSTLPHPPASPPARLQSFQTVTEDLKRRFAVNGEPLIDESVVGSLSRGTSPHWSNGSFSRQTGFQLPGLPPLSSSGAWAHSGQHFMSVSSLQSVLHPLASGWLAATRICVAACPPCPCAAPSNASHMRPGTSAGSGSGGNGGNGGRTSGGLLSQQMSSSIAVEPPPRPPSAAGSGHGHTPPVYISGHGPGVGGGNGGSRSGAVTPEDAPSTRNGSKPASPKALEAQVAKLVQGQQMLSNQLEELALQISLAQSGLGAVVPRALQQHQQQQAAAAASAAAESQQQQRPGLWQQLCSLGSGGGGSGSLPPAAWAAAGALAGTAATLLLMQGRQ